MARRTKRPRVVWLPNTNAHSIDPATTNSSVYSRTIHNVAGIAGEHVNSQHGVIIDGEGQDPLGATTSLSDVVNNGYRLRRIVGKIWAACLQQDEDSPTSVIATAAFMVLRVNPITATPLSGNTDDYYAGSIEQSMDPWIWRRSWVLGNGQAAGALNDPFSQQSNFGVRNNQLGGNSDGPHVDQKTARIIGPEERLFLCLGTTVLGPPTDPQSALTASVTWVWDLRVLGSMRSNTGNRRNASR